MGIDIYARWQGMRDQERNAQYTGFSILDGHVGYLREAYHGEPYATRYLCQEAFAADDGTAPIPAAVLRERLPETLTLVEQRERDVYQTRNQADIREVQQSFVEFVELCERKERETGEPCTIIASY
jgi:hypothetical protein